MLCPCRCVLLALTPLYSNLVWCCVCALWFVRWPLHTPRTAFVVGLGCFVGVKDNTPCALWSKVFGTQRFAQQHASSSGKHAVPGGCDAAHVHCLTYNARYGCVGGGWLGLAVGCLPWLGLFVAIRYGFFFFLSCTVSPAPIAAIGLVSAPATLCAGNINFGFRASP